uniref:E3 ubiquitin/ISG15 ligase TRIM25 n=1 Tax=Maylandia zebra TaxID=106582 RepID=UPI000D2F6A6D|nr:E3 ubiquitin/ISG15 ligase TRIM25-like [Maylandia zebra]
MAQQGVQVDRETITCSICLDLLKDPVAIPCGHSYCMNCIKSHFDEEDRKGTHSCPQCRKTFTPRPVLVKNIVLADLVEQLKKTGLQAAPADHCYAGPEDVACDVCTGRKLKAIKSCLVCLASYCEKHLQPHYDAAPLKKHKLVAPSKKLQENICSRHDEVMKIFCRTDQQSICYLCTMDEHKGHETVPAAAERTEKQKELEVRRLNIQQRIQEREKDVKLLQQEVEAINGSADKAVEDSEKMFTELIRLLQKRSSDVKQQVRSQQETEVSRVKELQEKLEQEIAELKRKDSELEQFAYTEDHNQFLHNYPSLSALSESTHSSSINIRPLSYFEDVTAAVSETRDKLQDILRAEEDAYTSGDRALYKQARNTLTGVKAAERIYSQKLKEQLSANNPADIFSDIDPQHLPPSHLTFPNAESTSTTTLPNAESTTTTTLPNPDATTTTTLPNPDSTTTTTLPNPDSTTTITLPNPVSTTFITALTPLSFSLKLRIHTQDLAPIFTRIFKRSLELCEIPSSFKHSTIIPVPQETHHYRTEKVIGTP